MLLEQMGATVISASQVGYLQALKTGYRFLLQQSDCHTVVQLDADGQHNPLHIPRLIVHIQPDSSTPQWIVGSRNNTGTQADKSLNPAGGYCGGMWNKSLIIPMTTSVQVFGV